MVDKIHLFILATFGESHEGGGLVELIFVVARKERERGREGGKMAGCTYKAGTHKGLGGWHHYLHGNLITATPAWASRYQPPM